MPFRWLSGNQTPDHNTLSRFYRTHRDGFHHLFHASIEHAVIQGQVDWGLQAIDGTKLSAHASGDRMLSGEALAQLAGRVETAITQLETGLEPALDVLAPSPSPAAPRGTRRPVRLPRRRQELTAVRERIARAQARIAAGQKKGNLTDPDAHQMTARKSNRPSYNVQAVVRPLPGGGRLIVALDVRTRADDHEILPDLAIQAAVTVADTGYHSGAVLATCHEQGLPVVAPPPVRAGADAPYGPDAFPDDPASGGLICPQGVTLTQWRSQSVSEVRYGAPDTACRGCPAKAQCCPGRKRGRVIVRSMHHAVLVRHRDQMTRPDCQALRRRRSGLIEGVFGTLKTRHGARQCLLRGLANVQADWTLLATAFNLRSLSRLAGPGGGPDRADRCAPGGAGWRIPLPAGGSHPGRIALATLGSP